MATDILAMSIDKKTDTGSKAKQRAVLYTVVWGAEADSYLGCYKKSKPFPSAGNYNTSTINPTICKTQCGTLGYKNAVLFAGKYCLCSDTLPPVLVTDDNCTDVCPGAISGETCGGPSHYSIYRATTEIRGLAVTTGEFLVGAPGIVRATVTEGNVSYRVDFGDGAGLSEWSATGVFSKTFAQAGSYVVRMFASDRSGTPEEKTAAVAVSVSVQEPAAGVQLSCPPVSVSWDVACCNASIAAGSQMKVTADYGDGSNESFSVAEPRRRSVGPAVPVDGSTLTNSSSGVHIMPQSEILEPGTIVNFEYYAGSPGDVDFLVLRPSCPGGQQYCCSANICNATCDTTPFQHSCPALFSAVRACCISTPGGSCTEPGRSSLPIAAAYKVVYVMSHTISSGGYGFASATGSFEAACGDVIGYVNRGGSLVTRPLFPGEKSDLKRTNATANLNEVIDTSSDVHPPDDHRHYLRAATSRPSLVRLCHSYRATGNFTTNLTVTNKMIPNAVHLTATTEVLDGINETVIIGPEYVQTGVPITFELTPHTGQPLTYQWTISNGNTVTVSEPTFVHTFSLSGTYNVTVRAFNALTDKTNFTVVTVLDPVTSVHVSTDSHGEMFKAHGITFNTTGGTDYKCTIDFGDSTTPETILGSAALLTGASISHMYNTSGIFVVNVTCFNLASSVSATATVLLGEVVTGLRLLKEGGGVNQLHYIEFEVATGTDLEFELFINGTQYSVEYNALSKQGRWASPIQSPSVTVTNVTLRAFNDFSQDVISVDFTIDEAIMYPTLVSSNLYALVEDEVFFTLRIEGGTSVKLEFDFNDGTTFLFTTPPRSSWIEAVPTQEITRNHSFSRGGTYSVTVTVYNGVGNHTLTKEIHVLTPIANVSLSTNSPVSFLLTGQCDIFVSQTGGDPIAGAQIEIKYGDGTDPVLQNFVVDQVYRHQYQAKGAYDLRVNVSNLMSSMVLNAAIEVFEPVQDMRLSSEPAHATVNQPITLKIKMYRGERVRFYVHFGDDATVHEFDRQGVRSEDEDLLDHTYTYVGNYTITVTATSPLGNTTKTYYIAVQHPVIESDFSVSSSAPTLGSSGYVDITVVFAGSTVPTEAAITVLWGRGGQAYTPLDCSTSPCTRILPRPVNSGVYSCTVIISNLATSVQFSVDTSLYEEITWISAKAMYQPFIPIGGPDIEGFGGDTFPLTRDVKFYINNTGIVEKVDITAYTDDISHVVQCVKSDNPPAVLFPAVGSYTVNITAQNPFSAASTALNINIFEPVEISDIYDDGRVRAPGENKTVDILLKSRGTDSCVYIEFDGIRFASFGSRARCASVGNTTYKGAITSSLISVTTTFEESGRKQMVVHGFNEWSNETRTFSFTISYIDCVPPYVQISQPAPDFFKPRIEYKSSYFNLQGITEVNCGVTLRNSKQWTAHQVDERTGDIIREITLDEISSAKEAEIALKPHFLDYGVFKFSFTTRMLLDQSSGNDDFSNSAFTYVRVMETPIVVAAIDQVSSKIRLGHGRILTLKPGTYSKDPDLDPDKPQNFTGFEYLCRQVGENFKVPAGGLVPYDVLRRNISDQGDPANGTNLGGCFGDGPGFINGSSGELSINTTDVRINTTYEVFVVAYKGSRKGYTVLLVDIVEGDPPEVAIRCGVGDTVTCSPAMNSQVVPWRSRIALTSECLYGCYGGNLHYEWDLEVESQEGEFTIWHKIAAPENYFDSHNGSSSSTISIKADIFTVTTNVTKIRVKLEASRIGSSRSGLAELVLKVNPPPQGGYCSAGPNISEATAAKNWTVNCTNWHDNDGIASYTFYTILDGSSDPKILGMKTTGLLQTSMPLGPSSHDYWMTVYVNISDTKGSTTNVEAGRIQVNPVSASEASALCDRLSAPGDQNPLSEIEANGNLDDTAQSILSWASIINSQGCIGDEGAGTGTGTSAQNRTDEENENIRQTGADIRKQMIAAINATPSETPSQVIIKASTLAPVLSKPSEIHRESQEVVVEVIQSFVKCLEDFSEDLTIEETVTLVNLILGTMGNILETTTIHLQNPLKKDVEESLKTAFYNTDLEDTKLKNIDGLSAKDAVNGFAKMTNNDNQKEVADGAWTKMTKSMDSVLSVFSNKMVLGEPTYTLETPDMTVILVKSTATDLENLDQPLVNFHPGSLAGLDGGDGLSLQIVEFNFNPVEFLESSVSALVSNVSKGVYIDILDNASRIVEVSHTQEPIEIMVKRDHTAPIPEPFYVTASQSPMSKYDRLSYRSLWVNETDVSLHIEIVPEEQVTFLVLVRHETAPQLEEGGFDAWQLVPSVRLAKNGMALNSYEVFMDSVGNKTGKYFIGLRQLLPNETDMYGTDWADFQGNFTQPFTGVNEITTNYTMRVYTSSCLFVKRLAPNLRKDGCVVGNATTHDVTQCLCNHLTTFLGGWVVMPNTIDWNFVFSGAASFDKNATLYITEIIIGVIYILMAIWARRQDKKDIEKLGVTPLLDNDPSAHYLYEVVVFTGLRRDAGTESKVCFILSGEHDETDVRVLSDDKRSVFKRGAVDRFLLAVTRPLGTLNYARIWHDNSGRGKFASWYLKYFLVIDLQTKEKYYFICNRWFAVEEDDGQVDRLIPVAGREQMAEFGHLFTKTTQKNLGDGHLWFSVIARPAQSRFTRLQRVSCCLCLLFLTMLTSAMFYGQVPESPGANAITFGPFSLSPEQIFVGIIGTVIVFPVNLLIITLFRKSRPRKKRPSRIKAAMQRNVLNQGSASLNSAAMSTETLIHTHTHPEKNQIADWNRGGASTSTVYTNVSFKARPDTSFSSEIEKLEKSITHPHEDYLQTGKKKKKFELPWWCRIVAWVILWICVFGAAAMVTFFGISFGDTKARKWITSMLISFVTSVFLTEPIKIFLLAIFFSMIIKKVDEDEEEEEGQEDEEDPQLQHDELLLHPPDTYGAAKPRKIAYKPPDPTLLEQARENRLKELRMYDILREIIFYSVFVWMLLVISYGNRDPYNFYLREHMENEFVFKGHTTIDFTKLQNSTQFWLWYREGLAPALRALNWYNNDFPVGQRGFLADRACRMMGYATMRQVRVKPGQCKVEDVITKFIPECNDAYNLLLEDESPYGVGWVPFSGSATHNNSAFEYEYRTSSELDGYPFYGQLTIYGGGGYLAQLRGSYHKLLELGERLEREWWIDKYTRAVLIEFTCYNPGVNLFSINTMAVEFHQSGGIVTNYRFEPVRLLNYVGSAAAFQIACEIIYFIFIFFFIYKESKKIWHLRCRYFAEFWNLVEFSVIGFSIGGAVVFFYRMIITNALTKTFKKTHGNEYTKFQYAGYWNETFSYMLGLLCFLGTLKFLKLLRFNKRMSFLAATLKDATTHLFAFSVIFFIIFFAFVQFFTLDMGPKDYNFANLLLASESLMQMMLGKFDFYRLASTSELAPYFFVLFVVLVTWITLNMLLSILNESFTAVKNDLSKQPNEHEMVDFIVNRFKTWTGLGTPSPSLPSAPTPDKLNNELQDGSEKDALDVSHFPEKVDKFLNSIGRVYFDLYTASGKDAFKKMLKDNKLKARVQRGFSRNSSNDAEELAML
ncbi:uncharacterized protein LOC106155845 [Lingula anatina]|uniref:Uncharacterized protein LOC106155845 n=1 Tax=Lingula anatina TaxID=7574 RepID=A0A1S3HMN1_LINAN|nr:uncharacterized protein LOC106155845 [Lingula anatina]|eukprot:XP_013386314.1 uncharacterized protein LOC106155845 [Lingula anatina]